MPRDVEIGQGYDEIPEKDPLLKHAWQQNINAPQTSSVGRLFDAATAFTGVRSISSFEGQGAMEFEALCKNIGNEYIELDLDKNNDLLITNWQPLVTALLNTETSINKRSALFHHSLAHAMLQQAKAIRDAHDVNIVSLSGGVFQNRVLTERAMSLLSDNGFKAHLPELIPVNDAGISFGQVMEYGLSQKK